MTYGLDLEKETDALTARPAPTCRPAPPADAWATHRRPPLGTNSRPLSAAAAADAEVVKRDRDLTELENVLSGSAWDLWAALRAGRFPKASQAIVEFWAAIHSGKAVLILDGLSLREVPWLLLGPGARLHHPSTGVRGSELPAETTPFANALGFAQRSALENNGAGSAHKLTGACTESCDLPWKDCVERGRNAAGFVFWHHWPDERMHDLAGRARASTSWPRKRMPA